ncbi:translocation/assembly module TamB domain-containing protein [Thalassobacter stenotrophicus]|uniref:Translocation and assembly module TamB C-terminal domain-containing protein n=2 Tax=Thalassobacter stenotrophicus TaxID=266809 RepID=A0A0P1F2S7_9RHOB|nr:translocation/assembly module TamB domain-containing protein [Thalassobacter stenotrophicus]PVZ49051.1 translocation/assembly module TamB [Thalassobacter stenotrophicus]CUH61964.1 hypothetical protein THS5294_03278 [Thalassobacter stenotrophicus]SHI38015.1 autotransporter secretion inner membrane protein TamB [Thalassobacter stenotrophicus DSM 16310]
MRFLLACVVVWGLGLPAFAQQDEDGPGYLAGLLQNALSGAGREVRITGFEGALSSTARMEQMTIADDAGVWLTLTDVTLDWARSALLRGRVEVNTLTAASLNVSRPPQSDPDLPSPEATPFRLPDLPVSIEIGTLEIEDITLGQEVLGQPIALRLEGAASLAGGAGAVRIEAARIDDIAGRFAIEGSLDADGTALVLSLRAEEAAGGLVPTLTGLPGAPSVALGVEGTGSLDDFAADLTLATDGQSRLSGRVGLRTQGPVEAQERVISADIGGDLAPLFAPDYAAFFGDAVALKVSATQMPDGALDLSDLSLQAQRLDLRGTAAIGANGWPEAIDITGQIADAEGGDVLLPLAGTPTRVGRVDLSVQFDAARGDAVTGRFAVTGLDRLDVRVADMSVALDGTLSASAEGVGAFAAGVVAQAAGIAGLDPEIAQALGADVVLSTDVRYASDAPLELRDLVLTAGSSRLAGFVQADNLGANLRADLDLRLTSGELARFAALTGQPLGGAGEVRLAGTVMPVSGAFDLAVGAVTQDLSVGVPQADALLVGRTDLAIAAVRDAAGLRLDAFSLSNPEISAEAAGTLGSQAAELSYEISLRDVAKVAPGVTGVARSAGQARLAGGVWQVDATATGPFDTALTIAGPVTGPMTDIVLSARVPNVAALVPELSGPLNIDARVQRPDTAWIIAASADGLAGLQAQIEGFVDAAGAPDFSITGSLPLALARPFIAPRAVGGTAQFDLGVRGGFGLGDLAGQVSIRDARISDPGLRLVLEDVRTDIALQSGQARVDMAARNRAGGSVAVAGGVGLLGARTLGLDVRLNGFTIADPQLYETSVDGAVAVSGPLETPQISGDLTLGETNIIVPSTGISGLAEIPEITHLGAPEAVQTTRRRAGLIQDAGETGAGGASLGLDVSITAPGRLFVRGRGLDAELGGALRVTGTTGAPVSAGAFELIRGRLDILQKRYVLEEGLIQMQGTLEPYLRFVAATRTSAGGARVIVEGDASAPEVSFVSDPEAPEEEVLAQLLFDRNLSEMSAFQAVQLASAVATLAGRGGVGIIGNLREGLGLDDFDVTTTAQGNTALSAGKYISDNAYTDVTVDSTGNSEVSLNIDLTPNFKARGSVAADGNSALGLFFERDY